MADGEGPRLGRRTSDAPGRDRTAAEIRLLGSLLGEVIVEQAGREAYELVEATRRRAVAIRRAGQGGRVSIEVSSLDPETVESVVRAFGLYFQLVNIAERRAVVRAMARRARVTHGASETEALRSAFDAHASRVRRGSRAAGADPRAVLARLSIAPVLTAHPTEARRRTVLIALRRIATLLERFDDPRLTPSAEDDMRRRLREEIALLWQTAELRTGAPTPLDEVRTAMVFFDETIYRLAPRLYRLVERAVRASVELDDGAMSPPVTPAFLRLGSWIGGDRDGHPDVTAATTEAAIRVQADHVLHGHEAVATRLAQTIAAKVRGPRVPATLGRRLALDADDLPDVARSLAERFPDEPFRQRFGFIAERLRRTRDRLAEHRGPTAAGYERAEDVVAELAEIQVALVAVGLPRSAWGEVQDFRWQVETFGFGLANLELRQHASVHRARLQGGVDDRGVDATFAALARIQRRFGIGAASRYVVSFTAGPDDVLAVLELARRAVPERPPVLDVVPLFESSDALTHAGAILDSVLTDGGYRDHLRTRGDRQEVMLGYSDSNKESGYLAANWLLHRAEEDLVATARRHGIALTLFHGRGGAIGRGGGALEGALMGQPPGSVDLRLKVTEQGEVIAARYTDPDIALAHLATLTAATVAASSEAHARQLGVSIAAGSAVMEELAASAARAYRALVVDDPGFAAFFARMTPIDEISGLRLGSRPAARPGGRRSPGGRSGSRDADRAVSLDALRAIPWVFAWSQARVELPGWFGVGSALEAYARAHGDAGMEEIAGLARSWPFLGSVLGHARMAVERADLEFARAYAALATEPGDDERWRTIEREHDRTVAWLDRVLPGDARAAEAGPAAARRRSEALRAPYVDTLSAAQVGLLAEIRLREVADPDDPEIDRLRALVRLTISGLAAGLQGTG